MATKKTDFLKFNAYSMKELITRKMSEDSNFTDQIYEGSNLAILIDLVAYMYQVLMYQLNNAASESMFSDTQVYENISRLVKMIGYHPKGCTPATLRLNIYRENDTQAQTLLKYSRIDTGLTDSRGEKIYFSVPDRDSLGHSGSIDLESETTRTVTLVNGQWKMYPQILVASGIEYETFTLDLIASDSSKEKYIADGYISIYIKRNGLFSGDFEYIVDSEELLLGTSKSMENSENGANRVYNNESQVFSLNLNENKVYEIKFGDGTTGKKLEKGDQLFIFYLETNGKDGAIDVGSVDFDQIKFEHGQNLFGGNLTNYDYQCIFETGVKSLLTDDINKDKYSLSPQSLQTTSFKPEQSVDDIREYAPTWFKMGNRLLTRNDYEFFVKSSIPQVIDVKCMNNWEYLATFYKWLYDCGVKYHKDSPIPGRYYFDENIFLRNGFDMVDAADANNIYIWVQTQQDFTLDNVKNMLKDSKNIDYLKILTSELQFLKPIPVVFDVCACYTDVAQVYAKNDNFADFIDIATKQSYLEITLEEECIYVNSYIINRIQNIFSKYFNPLNLKIGQNINISDILDEIYSIGGISRVRTVFQPQGTYQYDQTENCTPRAIDGIALMSWTNGFINYGEDVQIGNTTRHILDFQFPVFNVSVDSLVSRIKIIKKQLTNISNIKF